MKVFGQLEVAQMENLAADPTGTGNVPGRVYYNTTTNQAKIYNSSAGVWQVVGGGSGLGAFLGFYPNPGDSPIEGEDGAGLKFWEFEDEQVGQILWGFVKVPNTYAPGVQLKLAITVESDEVGSAQLIMQAQTYLIRKDTDALSSVTNSETNTANYSPGSLQAKELLIDLTDANGEINSIAVAAGDILKVALSKPTDASTENIRLFESLVEVR